MYRFRLALIVFMVTAACLGTGCIEQRHDFLSPFPNTQNSYTATPMISDSLKIASYGSLSLTNAVANSKLVDNIFMSQVKIHQALFVARNLQVFYGLQGSAGVYKIDWNDYYYFPPYADTTKLRAISGNKFTGAAGLFGGFALVIPMGNVVEWRVLGAEFYLSKEFGEYQRTRTNLADSIVELVDKNQWPGSFGGFTELNFRLRDKKSMGFHFGVGSTFTTIYSKTSAYTRLRPVYVNTGFHFSIDRYSGFLQGKFGDYFAGIQTGISYRF